MRLLIYAPNYLPATRYGGPIASSHGLAKALVGLGHEVHVFTTNVDGPGLLDVPLETPVEIDGVCVRYFPVATPKRLYYSPAMGRAIDAEVASFDAVHINGMYLWPGPRLAAAAARSGVRSVISPRGMLVRELIAGKSALIKKAWIAGMERPSLARASAIHVTSDAEHAGVSDLGLDLAPMFVLGNGVDAPEAPARDTDVARIWRDVAPGSRVAFLGRLDWTKGLDLAIEAVRRHPSAHLLIAGPDQIGLRSQLEPRLRRDDGSLAGRFIGPVHGADKWAFLSGADLLLAPSLKESFGMSVAEALCVGTPVACTPGVGAAAIVVRTDAQAVVPRTTDGLAEALDIFLADPQRRRAAGAQGAAIMAADYTWTAIAQRMAEVYRGTASVATAGGTAVPALGSAA